MKKIFLAALAATTLFASCAKEDNGQKIADGAEAKMDLVISFPQTLTRAADGNANAQDVAIDKVKVFIFNADGSHAAGSPSADLTLADFDDEGDNVYALKETSRITTAAGSKKIYVGINLPGTLNAVANETVLIEAVSTLNLYTATEVAMLSAGQTENLQSQAEGVTTPTANRITVNVERLVAKVAVTKGSAADYTVANGAPDGGTFKVAPDKFSVGNLATDFYPVQRVVSSALVTPVLAAPVAPLAQVDLNANGTAASALTSTFYVPEHSTTTANLRGEATYAVVRGELTFTHLATVVSDVITLTPASHTGDVWVVTKGANSYFCATEAIANEVGAELGLGTLMRKYEEAPGNKYYTFYYLFINRDETDRLAVYRNQFINITIDGVNGIGVPGDPGDPTNPPTEVVDPQEPVFDTEAFLEVIVDVQAWTYMPRTATLE